MGTTQHMDELSDELAPGTSLLHGQYVIERYLVRGGFGVTYLARDSLERRVVIKESFPNALSYRDANGHVVPASREKTKQFESITRHFLREARRMSRLKHPNIVGVHQVFEENNTAYMALDYLDGVDLLMVIDEEPERLTPDLIRDLMIQSLKAVKYIHNNGILHRDISPDNFLLDWDDTLTLIDFGAAREHATKEHRALSALLAVKDGYSPQEFYLPGVNQTEASDLYSLGATFYHVLTGEAPPHSQKRLAAVAGGEPDPYEPLAGRIDGFDHGMLDMIDRALEVFPAGRPQSAEEWLAVVEHRAERARDTAPERVETPAEDFPDPPVDRKISALVEDTNKDIQQGKPGDLKRVHRNMSAMVNPLNPVRPTTQQQETNASGQPVDIFGNPIEDVQKWLREQDKQLRSTKRKEEGSTVVKPRRPRFIRSLLNRAGITSDDPNRTVTN
jgi:serine/threonine protein kinase